MHNSRQAFGREVSSPGHEGQRKYQCWDEETPDNDGPETTKPCLKAVRITGWDDGKKVSQGARNADERERNIMFLQERLAQKADRRSKCAHKPPEEQKVAEIAFLQGFDEVTDVGQDPVSEVIVEFGVWLARLVLIDIG